MPTLPDCHDSVRVRLHGFVELVKPRILLMSVLTALGAMSVAPGPLDGASAVYLLLGTALIVGSANTLNMWLERDVDGRMSRTKYRPLPTGRIDPTTALGFGAAQGALALPLLVRASPLSAQLGVIALVIYVGVYTPLKRRSHHAVWAGAIAGAMPALMGWSAAMHTIDLGGMALFALLFVWQIPHTHAIGIYRHREYEAAGLHTLARAIGSMPAARTVRRLLIVQVAISLVPLMLGIVATPYVVAAIPAGLLVLAQARSPNPSAGWARGVFVSSLIYLPLVFGGLIATGHQ
jgi:protoheme IX farnesyltransferase